jgi:hypothetical protein
MDAPTISIKIKGLQALNALNGGLGGVKINGANALLGMGGMEANRAVMAQKGLLMREMEMEGNRMMLAQPPNGAGAGIAKAAATTNAATGTTAATTATNVGAKSAAVAGTKGLGGGAAVKSMGYYYSPWLGALGPWVILASVGLAATGIYFYLRAQRMMLEGPSRDHDPDDR